MTLSASTANGEFVLSPNKMDTVIVAFREIGVNAFRENVQAALNERPDAAGGVCG
jgi:hypothetical protein